jgi:hypothetical protein
MSASSFEKTRTRLFDFTQTWSKLPPGTPSQHEGRSVRASEASAHAAACSVNTTSRTGMDGAARRVRTTPRMIHLSRC